MCPQRVRSGGRDAHQSVLAGLPALASFVMAVVILGPGLGPGYLLRYDLVFVPRQPLTWSLLGLSAEAPRAVPSDLLVALASHVLPSQVVHRLVLLGLLTLAGAGASRVIALPPVGQVGAAVAYVWSPYVGERLLIGQWAVLIGYAVLPWAVAAAIRFGHSGFGLVGLAGWLLVVALGGGAAWVVVVPAVVVALIVSGWGRPAFELIRTLLSALVVVAVVALPWAVPAVTRPGGFPAEPGAAAVFAPSADTRLGSVVSLLTGGGIWSSAVVPAGRDTVIGTIAALCVLLVSATGWWRIWRGSSGPRTSGLAQRHRCFALAATGLLGLGLALVGLTPGIARFLAELPGGGLLRDSQRSLAPWCLVVAVGAGALVPWLVHRTRTPAAVALLALPVAALPSLAWGISARLQPATYPADVLSAARMVSSDPRTGAVLVLPFEAYRELPWNGSRVSLDPFPRLVDRTVVVSSDLRVQVGGRAVVVPGEDRLAARARRALAGPNPVSALGALGVRWVIDDGGAGPLGGSRVVFSGPDVTVSELPVVNGPAAEHPDRADRPPAVPVLAGDAVWLAAILAALAATSRRGARRLLLFGNPSEKTQPL